VWERETKLSRLAASLEVDHVLSAGQLERHYGLSLGDLDSEGFTLIEAFLSPSQGSRQYTKVRFVSLYRNHRKLESNALRHLAGVAEVRHVVGGVLGDWRSLAAARGQPLTPDALWETPRGRLAIEYDAGSYSPTQIKDKAKAFRHYAGQVWGTSSRQRVRHLWHLLHLIEHRCIVAFAPWL
jgi:hypothetical protein